MASIFNALGPIRNQATLAHPNDRLLDVPEARLGPHRAGDGGR